MGTNAEQGGRAFFQSQVFSPTRDARAPRPAGTVEEPARRVPLLAEVDVLVVGGGPAGTAAAIAAAREGARTLLIERHNHLGGLSTGGLVIWIDRMTDWSGRTVIGGIATELLDRLPTDAVAGPPRATWGSRDAGLVAHWSARTAAFHGIVTHSPTVDPERLKIASEQLCIEAGARILYHAWGASPIMEGNRVAGAFLEAKDGRLAVRAAVTIDATGDGDILARAGAAAERDIDGNDIHHCMNTSWLFGGVDMDAFIAFRRDDPAAFSAFMQEGRDACGGLFDRPFVSWRREVALFMGPRFAGYDAADVEDLTEAELRSRALMAAHLDFYRAQAPGFGGAFLMLGAPQLGVRHTRRMVGVGAVTRADWTTRATRADEIGVSPSLAPRFASISVPYGCIIPRDVDGLLAPGRHVSCDATSHSFMREIPQCWLTGQAAGAAAAIAARANVAPRAVDVGALQAALRRQGTVLGRDV